MAAMSESEFVDGFGRPLSSAESARLLAKLEKLHVQLPQAYPRASEELKRAIWGAT